MFKNKSAIAASLLAVMLISGCAKYTPKPLPNVLTDSDATKNEVAIYAYGMTQPECKAAFSRDTEKHGLRAVHLSINNNTDKTYTLNVENISMAIEPREVVARTLEISTSQRVISWAIPGIFIQTFFIPAMYEYFATTNANKALQRDFDSRVLSPNSRCNLLPGAKISKVFFVRSDNFKNAFSMKLLNEATGKTETFKVALHN